MPARRPHDQVGVLTERNVGALAATSEVEAMNTSFCFLAAWRSTTSVPWTFVSRVCTGFSTMSFTPGSGEVKNDIGAIHELGNDRVIEDGVDGVVKSGTPFEMGDVLDRAG